MLDRRPYNSYPSSPTPRLKRAKACAHCGATFNPRRAGRPQLYCTVACRYLAAGLPAPPQARRAKRWHELHCGLVIQLDREPSAAESVLLAATADLILAQEALSNDARSTGQFLQNQKPLRELSATILRNLLALGLVRREGGRDGPDVDGGDLCTELEAREAGLL